ncbi:MAG: glycosyltransferase family 1 protein [Gemmatimonadales bacterium]
MRIALVTDTYTPQVNGVTTIVRRVVEVLGRARQDVVVVAPEYPVSQRDTVDVELRVPSVAFPLYPALRLSLPQPRRVALFLDAFRPDLAHVMTEGPLGLVGRQYALRRGLPLVTSYHTDFPQHSRYYGLGTLESAIWHWLVWFHRPAVLTHTPGAFVKAELERRGLTRVRVWGRTADTEQFDHRKRDVALRRRLGVPDAAVLVLHVGRLAKEKNLDVLAAAWTRARAELGSRAVFLFAGDGPMAPRLAKAMPWAIQLGFLGVAELAALYASADLYVLPSCTETCGLVALEAMASGLPVIAADAGGFRESVTAWVNGFLIAPDDVRAFASAIAQFVLDPELRQRMGAEARLATVMDDRGVEDERLLADYAETLGRHTEEVRWRAA